MGVTSNSNGYYSIKNQGSVVLICIYRLWYGYIVEIDLNRDFELKTNAYNLSEVTVDNFWRTSIISTKEEINVRWAQGIQSGNEGTSGFYVTDS